MMRACGILLPISSLPSRYGIGAFSQCAYDFIDFLEQAGQRYWQILPLGPTGYGDSPYQSFSAYAGNPYFIDLDSLVAEGLLSRAECEGYVFGDNPEYVDYEKVFENRFAILRQAFGRSDIETKQEYRDFVAANQHWLGDFCLYTAIKEQQDGESWDNWDEQIRSRQPEAMAQYREELREEIAFQGFLQYEFQKQWSRLKAYANGKGIQIIGDIPIYVAFDSADTWANPELFQFDEDGSPAAVAGCPPDGFSATGQLWGNPLYDWKYHQETDYAWWMQRMKHSFTLYDMVRVDHFRGFDEYYAIPFGDPTAEHGSWKPGPGMAFFDKLKEQLGELPIIAEDLGYLTPSVLKLLEDTGYPGMKVLEFAFDSDQTNAYLPHNHRANCVVYTGTHDNQTLKAWFLECPEWVRNFAIEYLDLAGKDAEAVQWTFIRVVLASVAQLAVIPLQDYLELGAEARINTPSTLGDNWKWRYREEMLTPKLAEKISKMAKLYDRY